MQPGAGGKPFSASHAVHQLQALQSYAEMLKVLEWNGKPRGGEATQLTDQAAAVRSSYPELLDGSTRVRNRRVYVLALEAGGWPIWLSPCAAL